MSGPAAPALTDVIATSNTARINLPVRIGAVALMAAALAVPIGFVKRKKLRSHDGKNRWREPDCSA